MKTPEEINTHEIVRLQERVLELEKLTARVAHFEEWKKDKDREIQLLKLRGR